jgi:hypothetical protein
VVRADGGFFDQELLAYLEAQGLSYIVVVRLTRWLKREAARVRADFPLLLTPGIYGK